MSGSGDRTIAAFDFDGTLTYGDSAGDRDLLAAADHPCWVNDPLDSVAPAV